MCTSKDVHRVDNIQKRAERQHTHVVTLPEHLPSRPKLKRLDIHKHILDALASDEKLVQANRRVIVGDRLCWAVGFRFLKSREDSVLDKLEEDSGLEGPELEAWLAALYARVVRGFKADDGFGCEVVLRAWTT